MLEITFELTKFQKFPSCRIFVDEDLLEEIHFSDFNHNVKIPLGQSSGLHDLRIEHFNKTSEDTHFQDGKIVSDTTIEIISVKIDDFVLNDKILLGCAFKPEWTNLDKPKDFPTILPQCRKLGPNGIWNLPFQLPIEDWLIEQIQNADVNLPESYAVESKQMEYELSPHSVMHHKFNDADLQQIKRIKDLIHG